MTTMENKLIETLMLTDEDKVTLLQDLNERLNIGETARLMLGAIEAVNTEQGEDVTKVSKVVYYSYLWRNAYMLGYQQALNEVAKAQETGLAVYSSRNMKKRLDDHRQIEAENAQKLKEWQN